MNPRQTFKIWSLHYDALSLRERSIVLFALVIGIYIIADQFLLTPTRMDYDQRSEEIADWQNKMAVLEQQSRNLAASGDDPLAVKRNHILELKQTILKQDSQLESELGRLMRPSQAAHLLEQVLQDHRKLKLLKLESDTTSPFTDAEDEEDSEVTGNIARFNLKLELRGDYLSTLAYLQTLENLPWKLFWDEITYQVETHPEARITMQLHTMGRNDG